MTPSPPRKSPWVLARLCTHTVLALTLAAACAKTSDIDRVDESNRVQDQRLLAIERDVGSSFEEQRKTLRAIERDLRAMRGRTNWISERTEQLVSEQRALSGALERSQSEQRRLTRRVEEQVARMSRFRLESENDLDKMRLQLGQLEKLLKSPIAKLPAKTAADKEFRIANHLLINGEFDLAADRFETFRKKHPKDKRGTEALFRRGQALFLMRKYDHALIPFFEVVDKAPNHELAMPSRWMLARALEETGDLKLAREFYAQLIAGKTAYASDATRRVAFINKLFPRPRRKKGSGGKGAGKGTAQ